MRSSHKRGGHAVWKCAMEVLEERRLLSTPSIDPIADVHSPAGKPVIVPVTGSDDDANAKLTYTVKTSNPAIKASIHKGNPYLQMTIQETLPSAPSSGVPTTTTLGTLTFQLFKDLAPQTIKQIVSFVRAGFYEGLTFHRIANLAASGQPPAYIVQGGDPAGTGSGGPGFQYRDEFNLGALFTGKGQLAMANSGDDSNGSQFFITADQTRFLDFNHTIFGQLVRGFDVLTSLTQEPIDSTDTSGTKPKNTLKMVNVQLINDPTDAVLTVSAPSGKSGTVTVTASDGTNTTTQQFKVTGSGDHTNEPAFIDPLPKDLVVPAGEVVRIPVSAQDYEGDSVEYFGQVTAGQAIGSFEKHTAVITPAPDFVGEVDVTIHTGDSGSDLTKGDSDVIHIHYFDAEQVRSAKLLPIKLGEGQTRSGTAVATFVDSNPAGLSTDWSATINWGNGATSPGTITKVDGTKQTYKITAGTSSSTSDFYKVRGKWPVSVTITGSKGGFKVLTGKASVINAPVTGKAASTITGTAGTALVNPALVTFNDPDSRTNVASNYTAKVDWGDGNSDTNWTPGQNIAVSGSTFTVSANHTYATPGVKHIRVTITDAAGASKVLDTTAYITGQVSGHQITVSTTGDAATNEQSTWTLAGTFNDTDDTATTWTALVDYGDTDKKGWEPLKLNADKTFQLKHKYADNNAGNTPFPIKVVITDDKGGVGLLTFSHTVNDVAPTVSINESKSDKTGVPGQPRTVDFKGSDIAAADKSGLTFSIDWGDGSTPTSNLASTTKSASHAFAAASDADGFTVTVTATDKDGKSSTDTYQVIITTTQQIDDPQHAGKKILLIGATSGADTIAIAPDSDTGGFKVTSGQNQLWKDKFSGLVQIYGGGGNDTITIDPSLDKGFELFGGDGNDSITGGKSDDTIHGDAGADLLAGGAGDDFIDGGDGDEKVVKASDGTVTTNAGIDGGDGNDILLGGAGDDSITGGNGNDLIIGGQSTSFGTTGDTANGGAGNDILMGAYPASTTGGLADPANLKSILAEWLRTDESYIQKVNHLSGPTTGKNKTVFSSNSSGTGTVQPDFSPDSLVGGDGLDLFIGTPNGDALGIKDIVKSSKKEKTITA